MKINWFTVIAQIINFMVLVWLMKKFLYRPILDAVAKREENIRAQLNDAAEKEAVAAKEKEDFIHRNQTFDAQKDDLMKKAVADADTERNRLLDEARQDADALKTKLQKAVVESQEDLRESFERKVREGVFDISAKALHELASADLQTQIVNTLVGRIGQMNESDLKKLTGDKDPKARAITVKSAFELDKEQQKAISTVLEKKASKKIVIEFITDPDAVGGVEISSEGFKLGWTIDEYIRSLEQQTDALLNGIQTVG